MESTTRILPDISAHFAQIVQALNLKSGEPDFALVLDFCTVLAGGFAPDDAARDPRTAIRLEEALVWRILARRVLRELTADGVFHTREKGAASGTRAVHPGLDTLAKTYERLRRVMDELIPPVDPADTDTATSLPMRMMKLLEETEGALEAALGLEPGEKCAFSPRLQRRENGTNSDADRS